MKKITLISIITFISMHMVYALSDFRPGYVILNSGDTLHGLIDLRGKRSRVYQCIFKENHQAPEQVFSPDEALAYRYTDGKYYISREVIIEGHAYRLFLEYLFSGVVDIFYFRGREGNNYLIESKDTMYELKIVKELVMHATDWAPSVETLRTYVKINKGYKDILKNIFAESPFIVDKVNKVYLTHNDLIEISKEFHTEVFSDEQPYIIYEKKLPLVSGTYGLIAGLGFNRMMVAQNSTYYTFNNNMNNPVIPAIGLFLSLNFPNTSDRTYIVFEGMYFNRKLQAQYNYPYKNQIAKSEVTLSQHVWQSSLMAKYRFPGIGIRPYLQGGIFYNRFFNIRYYSNADILSELGNYLYSQESNLSPYNSYDTGLSMGGGFSIKKWFIDLRYNFGLGMYYSVFSQAVQLNLGYSLN